MLKSDYLYMIIDNALAFSIKLPEELQGNKLNEHLAKFEESFLKIIAGFNQNLLELFLKISLGKNQNVLNDTLKKMELISYLIGPTGALNYLGPKQIEYILKKIDSFKLDEINEEKISLIADEQLEKEFGGHYTQSQALENQLSSAAFYLMNMGYSKTEIGEKFSEVRQDPSKLDTLFTLPQKEIYSMPSEISGGSGRPRSQEQSLDQSQEVQDAINQHITSIQQEVLKERAQKVDEIMQSIKEHVRENMTEQYERVFRQIHPDRLNLAFKILRQTKRKSKNMILLLEWFFCSHLLENIEVRVEHWQTSTGAERTATGVYTAGMSFSRYDQIIKGFSDSKLTKVINIARHILQNPTKRAIQKLGQDLLAETGFDEHLYFTD